MLNTETNLKTLIAGFIRRMHAESGESIRHITVTVHGRQEHFEPDRRIQHLAAENTPGVATISYQEMSLEGPIDNLVVFIASSRRPMRL
ncbi:hypothetical protein [Chitinophaga sp. 22620]|uniref:hypothetical protein n=1 Tax=Chitinophaga sp. 22620 TaxID=3453952 RepID=UPI003F82ED42